MQLVGLIFGKILGPGYLSGLQGLRFLVPYSPMSNILILASNLDILLADPRQIFVSGAAPLFRANFKKKQTLILDDFIIPK